MRRQVLAGALALVAGCAHPAPPYGPVALSATTGTVATASYAPWPQASHDARRSGAATTVGPQTGHLRWTRVLEGDVTPGPVIGPGGTVFAASNAGVLHALDAVDGHDLWTFKGLGGYGSDLSTSPAVLPDGTVLWPGPGGRLYALDGKGKLRWTAVIGGQVTSPAYDGDRLVVGTSLGRVHRLDPRTGAVVWTVDLRDASYGSVALSPTDPHRAYQTAGNDLVALDDGRVAWREDLGDLVEVSPTVAADGTVVVGGNAPYERGFSPAGKELWRYDRRAETYSSPVVTDDGLAYFGDHHGVVSVVDSRTGGLRARYLGPTDRPSDNRSIGVWTSPVVDARHDVYWGTRSGHVRGVAADGTVLFDLPVGATADSYPALGDGLLVVGLTDGRLLGIAA